MDASSSKPVKSVMNSFFHFLSDLSDKVSPTLISFKCSGIDIGVPFERSYPVRVGGILPSNQYKRFRSLTANQSARRVRDKAGLFVPQTSFPSFYSYSFDI